MRESDNKSILSELKNMKDRMELLFSEIFEGARGAEPEKAAESVGWEPSVDIWETDQEWVLVGDLPGVKDEDLRVELEESQLRMGGKREAFSGGGDARSSQIERPVGFFSRTFALPRNVKQDFIRAELKRGVLTIIIPKDDSAKANSFKIEVKSG